MRNRTAAARKAGRKWAWRDVAGYNKRTKLGSQIKDWSKDDLKKWKDSRKKNSGRRLYRKNIRLLAFLRIKLKKKSNDSSKRSSQP